MKRSLIFKATPPTVTLLTFIIHNLDHFRVLKLFSCSCLHCLFFYVRLVNLVIQIINGTDGYLKKMVQCHALVPTGKSVTSSQVVHVALHVLEF